MHAAPSRPHDDGLANADFARRREIGGDRDADADGAAREEMMQALKAAVARYRAELWQVLAIVLATLLSFLIASWLNIAEPFWSVITAAIVARITARGAVAYRGLSIAR